MILRYNIPKIMVAYERARRTKALEEKKKSWSEGKTGENKPSIGEEEIAEIVTSWTHIPVKKLESEESERLLKLDEILKNEKLIVTL